MHRLEALGGHGIHQAVLAKILNHIPARKGLIWAREDSLRTYLLLNVENGNMCWNCDLSSA